MRLVLVLMMTELYVHLYINFFVVVFISASKLKFIFSGGILSVVLF